MNIQSGPFQPKPSIITRPGILTLPDDLERYVVAPGGSVIVEIVGGDTVTVIDMEGLQPCEIITAASNGRMDATLLDRKPDGEAGGFLSILAGSDESARRAHQSLKRP